MPSETELINLIFSIILLTMRKVIPFFALLFLFSNFLSGQERYIIWHSDLLEFTAPDGSALDEDLRPTRIGQSHLLSIGDPSAVRLLNSGKSTVRTKVLSLTTRHESIWQDLPAGTAINLKELMNQLEPATPTSEDGRWDRVTAFFAKTITEGRLEETAALKSQMERRAATEIAATQSAEGVSFKQPLWMELDSPEDIDLGWTSRFPIVSVALKMVGRAEPLFQVDNLGYYRLQYAALNKEIKDQIKRNERYELLVTVRSNDGQNKMASTRFYIKKSLDFDDALGEAFAPDNMRLKWSSRYPVTEVILRNSENRDTLYFTDDPAIIEEAHKIPGTVPGGEAYQLAYIDFAAEAQASLNRGDYYDLIIAVSDARGAKRVYSKRYYCMSTEETLLKALNDDRDFYRKLMEFVESTPENEIVISEPADPAPSRLNKSSEVETEKGFSEANEPETKMSGEETAEESQPENAQQDAGRQAPVFYYSFDQPLIADQSGNNFNALGSILIPDRKGEDNKAYRFDGQQDFIALPPNESFVFSERSPFTLSFWVKSDAPTATLGQIYQQKGGEGSFFLDVKLENHKLSVWCCAKDFSCETLFGKEIPVGKWSHVAVTLDESAVLSLYVDGRLLRSRKITLVITDTGQSAMLFGKDQQDQNFLTGGMDEIYLFKRALTPDEIADLAK